MGITVHFYNENLLMFVGMCYCRSSDCDAPSWAGTKNLGCSSAFLETY